MVSHKIYASLNGFALMTDSLTQANVINCIYKIIKNKLIECLFRRFKRYLCNLSCGDVL